GGRAGWPAILSSLKSMLETGKAMVIPMQPPQRMLDALKELGIPMPG
ncbi:MAG TPA: ATPase, partial [Bradyrhizobium sp.]|nr:ATPase [Bradyrhizobium sp.]